jgi:hypothetical protein
LGGKAWNFNNNNYAQFYTATLLKELVITDLNNFLSASDLAAGWYLTFALGINNEGRIYGWAQYDVLTNDVHYYYNKHFILQAVPEADTSAMLLMGAGLKGFIARRRKQAAA